jgi:ribonuclease P protein component
MIPRTHRLVISSSNPFLGAKQRGNWLLVVTRPSSLPQWAVSVSKKIDNRAVVRNRLRRQINQWLFIHLSELKPQQFLVIPRCKPTNNEELNHLFEEMKKHVFSISHHG